MAPKRFPRTYIRRQTCLSKQFSNIYSSEFYYLIRYNRKKLHLFIAQQRFLRGCSTISSLFRISLWLCKYVISKPVFLFVYKFLLLNFFFPFPFVLFDRFGPSRNISLVGFNNRN